MFVVCHLYFVLHMYGEYCHICDVQYVLVTNVDSWEKGLVIDSGNSRS